MPVVHRTFAAAFGARAVRGAGRGDGGGERVAEVGQDGRVGGAAAPVIAAQGGVCGIGVVGGDVGARERERVERRRRRGRPRRIPPSRPLRRPTTVGPETSLSGAVVALEPT